MDDDIRNRTLTDTGEIINDPNRDYVRKRNQKIIKVSEDKEQRDQVGRKEALIERYGERKYDELVRKHGIDLLKH